MFFKEKIVFKFQNLTNLYKNKVLISNYYWYHSIKKYQVNKNACWGIRHSHKLIFEHLKWMAAKEPKKLKCRICDKKFVQSRLKIHVETVHEGIKNHNSFNQSVVYCILTLWEISLSLICLENIFSVHI